MKYNVLRERGTNLCTLQGGLTIGHQKSNLKDKASVFNPIHHLTDSNSATRRWSRWEVIKQIHDAFGDVESFVKLSFKEYY